jgi:hypothetical protein
MGKESIIAAIGQQKMDSGVERTEKESYCVRGNRSFKHLVKIVKYIKAICTDMWKGCCGIDDVIEH